MQQQSSTLRTVELSRNECSTKASELRPQFSHASRTENEVVKFLLQLHRQEHAGFPMLAHWMTEVLPRQLGRKPDGSTEPC